MTVNKAGNGFAWLVQVEKNYSVREIVAHIVIPQENGELHNPRSDRWATGPEYADFRVSAYLGESGSNGSTRIDSGAVWGLRHDFAPYRVTDLQHAQRMVTTLRKVEKGLAKAQDDAGYLNPDDYHGYLMRIAASLGIRDTYVINYGNQREWTGERHRKVNGAGLQWWVDDVSRLAETSPGLLVAS